MSFKKILVTTDLSEHSKVAFPVALSIASAFQSEVEALAVIEDPTQTALMFALDFPILPDAEVIEQLEEKVRADLKVIVDSCCDKGKPQVNVKRSVLKAEEAVHDAILRYACAAEVDLIVIATHGRTGLGRILIGSVAERIVRESRCPVLAVPAVHKK